MTHPILYQRRLYHKLLNKINRTFPIRSFRIMGQKNINHPM